MLLYLNNLCDDNEYFDYLYATYYNYAYKICYNILGDTNILEDVLQESFLKVYKTIGTIKKREAERAWIGAIVRNTAKDALKQKNNIDVFEVDIEEELIDLIIDNNERGPLENMFINEAVEAILAQIKLTC